MSLTPRSTARVFFGWDTTRRCFRFFALHSLARTFSAMHASTPSARDFRAEATAPIMQPVAVPKPRQPTTPPAGVTSKKVKLPDTFIADPVQVAEVLANRAFSNPYFESAFIVDTTKVAFEGDMSNKDSLPVNNPLVQTSLTVTWSRSEFISSADWHLFCNLTIPKPYDCGSGITLKLQLRAAITWYMVHWYQWYMVHWYKWYRQPNGTLVHGTLVHGTLVHGTLVHGTLVLGTLVHGTLVHGTLVPMVTVSPMVHWCTTWYHGEYGYRVYVLSFQNHIT